MMTKDAGAECKVFPLIQCGCQKCSEMILKRSFFLFLIFFLTLENALNCGLKSVQCQDVMKACKNAE